MVERVECLSDYTYAVRPIALTWEGQRFEIAQILAEWRTPSSKHFKVSTGEGQFFELIHDESPDAITGNLWQVHPIQE